MDPVCALTGGDNYTEQYVVHDGKLANVYVYIKRRPAGGDVCCRAERSRPW